MLDLLSFFKKANPAFQRSQEDDYSNFILKRAWILNHCITDFLAQPEAADQYDEYSLSSTVSAISRDFGFEFERIETEVDRYGYPPFEFRALTGKEPAKAAIRRGLASFQYAPRIASQNAKPLVLVIREPLFGRPEL